MMEKLVTVTTRISDEMLKELKKKTGEDTNKEALAKAIYHYIVCPEAEKEKNLTEKKKKTGRYPFYLDKILREHSDEEKG
jgi:hypothetical protein